MCARSQDHVSSPSDICKNVASLLAQWGVSNSIDPTSECFKFFQGLLEQCSPSEYSMGWFMQLSANSIGIKISQYHPLSIVDSPNSGSYFTDACMVYGTNLDVFVPLRTCDLMMCKHSPDCPNHLSPVELYVEDAYHMNHWALVCKIAPVLCLGQFPLEECKKLKVALAVVDKTVVEEDGELSNTSFGLLDGFGDQSQVDAQVLFSSFNRMFTPYTS